MPPESFLTSAAPFPLLLAESAHPQSVVVVDLLVILALATVVATIFRRLKLDSIPGFLIAGALAGPHALKLVRSPESVEQISALATILLMFTIGLHLDVSMVRRGMVHILGIGIFTTLGVTAGAWLIGVLMGLPAPAALLVAMGVSMSSTAVLVRVLGQRRELASTHGRVGLGVAIVQDFAAVVALALIPPIAKWASATQAGGLDVQQLGEDLTAQGSDGWPRWFDFVLQGARGLGGVLAMLLLGKYLLPRVIREVTKIGSSELLLIMAGAVALSAAIGTAALGFSPEMGAFLAGIMLAATPYRYQLSGQLMPIRDLLMVVFFTTVGLSLNPSLVADHWLAITIATVLILVLKTLVIAFGSWAGGMTASSGFLTGMYLGNAGEFTLVVLTAGAAAGILTDEQKGIAIAFVIASLVISPSLIGPAHAWAPFFRAWRLSPFTKSTELHEPKAKDVAGAGESPRGHVILAGFGPVARALADRFDLRKTPYTVIELNPRTVQKQTTIGRTIVYGDVTNPEVLESAGLHHADAVILTIPDEDAVLRACQAIRELAPDIFIAARTNYLSQAFRATQLGADHVTVEEVATAIAMEREVLQRLEARERKRAGLAVKPVTAGATSVSPMPDEGKGRVSPTPDLLAHDHIEEGPADFHGHA